MPAAKKKKAAGAKKAAAPAKKPVVRREIWALICLLFSFVAFLSFFNVSGFAIDWYKWITNFLCGYGFYLMPFALLASGIILAIRRKGKARLRVFCVMMLPLISGALRHLVSVTTNYGAVDKPLHALIQNSCLPASEGVLSGGLSIFFKAAISQVGAVVLFLVLGVLCLVIACYPSVQWLLAHCRPLPEPEEEELAPMTKCAPSRVAPKMKKAERITPPPFDIQLDEDRIFGKSAQTSRPLYAPEPEAPTIPPASVPSPADVLLGITASEAQVRQQEGQQTLPAFIKPAATAGTAVADSALHPNDKKFEDSPDGYIYPPVTLLSPSPAVIGDPQAEVKKCADNLVDTLNSFGIESEVVGVTRGPTVTRYELQIRKGIKYARVASLSDDIALALGAAGVRISTIPDKNAVGIEVPNGTQQLVTLRDILETAEFKKSASKLTFAVGKNISANSVIGDISKMPHMLIAGTTGSGKSVCINSLLISLLYKSSPEEVKLIMIDPKMIELGIYNGIPHLLIPVVTDPKKAAGALGWAVTEMMKRYRLFSEIGVRDMASYNTVVLKKGEGQPLPHIVIVIDELADLMFVAANEVEESVARIAQMARAAGMHLIIATQRPSADVITGIMKANIPSRIAFAVASQIESRIILDSTGAEKLIGRGDMLFSPLGANKPVRIQGCFVTTAEVESVVSFIKQYGKPDYSEEVIEHIEAAAEGKISGESTSGAEIEEDELLPRAIDFVVDNGQASVSMLQRRLKLGYSRAARLVDQMEERGIVGPFEGSKPRQVLITRDQWREIQLRRASLDE